MDRITNLTHHSEYSEKAIERYLVEQARALGVPCLKYSNPNMVGYPDRILVIPGGRIVWVELKSKGRHPSKIQTQRFVELRSLGHTVEVIDNKPDVDSLLTRLVK